MRNDRKNFLSPAISFKKMTNKKTRKKHQIVPVLTDEEVLSKWEMMLIRQVADEREKSIIYSDDDGRNGNYKYKNKTEWLDEAIDIEAEDDFLPNQLCEESFYEFDEELEGNEFDDLNKREYSLLDDYGSLRETDEDVWDGDSDGYIQEIADFDAIGFADEVEISGGVTKDLWSSREIEGLDYEQDGNQEDILGAEFYDRITRRQRAEQIAEVVGLKYDWDDSEVALLSGIFERHGWSACRFALERELMAGMVPIELKLADEIRIIWKDYPEFGEAFNRSGGCSQKFTHLPWSSALSLGRSFGAIPEVEEVEVFLVNAYYHWRYSYPLIRSYPSFRMYVDYRSGKSRGALKLSPWFVYDALENGWDRYSYFDSAEKYNQNDLEIKLSRFGLALDKSFSLDKPKFKVRLCDDVARPVEEKLERSVTKLEKVERPSRNVSTIKPIKKLERSVRVQEHAKRPSGSGLIAMPGNKVNGNSSTGSKIARRLTVTSYPRPSMSGVAVSIGVYIYPESECGTVAIYCNDELVGAADFRDGKANIRIHDLPKGTNKIRAEYFSEGGCVKLSGYTVHNVK